MESCNSKLVSFLLERDCDKIKDIEETATRFFTAHTNERLGKDSDFPFGANSAREIDSRSGRDFSRNQDNFRTWGPNRGRSKSQDWIRERHSDSSNYPNFGPKNRYFQSHNSENQKNQSYYGDKTFQNRGHESKTFNKTDSSMNYNRGRELRCFECSGKGHFRPQCPNLTLNTTYVERGSFKGQYPDYNKICTTCDGNGRQIFTNVTTQ